MEGFDKKEALFRVDEIFKYKDLIDRKDREIIKSVLDKGTLESIKFYDSFIELAYKEANHELNKEEFGKLRDELINEMNSFLNN